MGKPNKFSHLAQMLELKGRCRYWTVAAVINVLFHPYSDVVAAHRGHAAKCYIEAANKRSACKRW